MPPSDGDGDADSDSGNNNNNSGWLKFLLQLWHYFFPKPNTKSNKSVSGHSGVPGAQTHILTGPSSTVTVMAVATATAAPAKKMMSDGQNPDTTQNLDQQRMKNVTFQVGNNKSEQLTNNRSQVGDIDFKSYENNKDRASVDEKDPKFHKTHCTNNNNNNCGLGLPCTKTWYFYFEHIFGLIWNGLGQLFASPLQKDPIFFIRAEVPKVAKGLGVDANYHDQATKELIDGVFEERKDKIKGHEAQNWRNTIDMTNYPGWTPEKIEILYQKFQVLDVSGDGRITFDELSEGLDRLGNTTSKDGRKVHFDLIDKDQSGSIDFDEFLMMAYNLEKSDPDGTHQTLFDLYKSLDRDVAFIRNMTVIEQLQSGLF